MESGGIPPPFLTSVPDGDVWPGSRLGHFTPGEFVCGTHWIGRWVSPRASQVATEKRKKSYPYFESIRGLTARAPGLYGLIYAGSLLLNYGY
jgi:hypothetical protein